jgi:hypothetical protein
MQNLLPNTAVFIDYSNMFFTKYTVGRYFDLENLLQWCDNQQNISLIGMYGAFDNRNITQLQRKNRIQ